jgi:hypothetical protein
MSACKREEAMKRFFALGLLSVLLAIPAAGGNAIAGPPVTPFRLAGNDGGDGGMNINIIVRQLSFTPAVARVGDTIRIEVVIEDVDEGYLSIPARILANGKQVASQLFTFGFSKGNRIYRETFQWNTKGTAPGEYKIKADYFLQQDSSPFDNEMTAAQPLILVPEGAPFPEGKAGGGTATETDPRWKEKRAGG